MFRAINHLKSPLIAIYGLQMEIFNFHGNQDAIIYPYLPLCLTLSQNYSLYAVLQLYSFPRQHTTHVSALPTLSRMLSSNVPSGPASIK